MKSIFLTPNRFIDKHRPTLKGMIILTEEAKNARREYMRRWRKDHRFSLREYQRNWRAQNPGLVKEYQERYWTKKAFEKSFDRAELNAETD